MYDCNPYIECIFVFTALIHCTVCRDCSHTFVSFQTVLLLPARASEQGNVIGSVRMYIYIYIYMCVQFFFVIEQTRDLIYLKFVAIDFFPKIISPSAGENSGDLA